MGTREREKERERVEEGERMEREKQKERNVEGVRERKLKDRILQVVVSTIQVSQVHWQKILIRYFSCADVVSWGSALLCPTLIREGGTH